MTSTSCDQLVRSPLRVVVLERYDSLREILAEQLRRSGLGVIEAFAELQELEHWLSSQRTDVIVFSMEDSCYDGLALSARLRQEYPAVIQIAMSAHGSDHDRVNALNAGANYLCAKPVSFAELIASIHRAWLSSRAVVDASTASISQRASDSFPPTGADLTQGFAVDRHQKVL